MYSIFTVDCFSGVKQPVQFERFMKGVANCEETIRRLLNSEEALQPIELVASCRGQNSENSSSNKAPNDANLKVDRLYNDKLFLEKLTHIETSIPSRK